jgi:N4-gp56 family major capsid protein
MATDFGALSAARKKLWAADIWEAGRDASFWNMNGFIGDGSGNVIQRITQLTQTERGNEVIMQLVADLLGDGVVGDNRLEDNEEAMFNDAISLKIDQLRHGVRSAGAMAEQATIIRFRAQAKEKLGFWFGDKVDELMFLTAAGRAYTLKLDGTTRATSQLPSLKFAGDVAASSTNRIRHAGAATSEASLTTAETMNWNIIVATQAFAKRKRMKPIRSGGREYYALVMSTEQARDLKRDATYQTNVGRAHERGGNNPLFKGAFAIVDGVILYEHNKVFNTLGLTSGVNKWGSGQTVDGAQAMLLGAQALGFAQLYDTKYMESDNTDYGNRPGIAVGRMIGMLKPQFPSPVDANAREDFGIVTLKTAAAAT